MLILKIKLSHCTLAKFVTLLNLLLYICVLVSCFTLFVFVFCLLLFSFEVPHISFGYGTDCTHLIFSAVSSNKNKKNKKK